MTGTKLGAAVIGTPTEPPAETRGALWEDENYPLEARLQGAIGMIDFQAEIIAHRKHELQLKEEEITSLHKLIEGMRTRIYQLSGDMNVLAMENYYNKRFVKEVGDGPVDFHIIHVDGIGRIAVGCLDRGEDGGETGQTGPEGTEGEAGSTSARQVHVRSEGAQARTE